MPPTLRHPRACALSLALVGSLSVAMLPAGPSQAVRPGTLRVVITTPDGVAANVLLRGPGRQVFAKGPGTTFEGTRKVTAGEYRLLAPTVTSQGVLYAATTAPTVEVRPGRTTRLGVTYEATGGATGLRASALSWDTAVLRWSRPPGTKVQLRRTVGHTPASDVTKGRAVPVSGNRATDTDLPPGSRFSYALFSKVDGSWVGPLGIRVKLPTQARRAAAVLPRSSVVLLKRDAGRVSISPDGLRIDVPDGRKPPTLGSGVSIAPQRLLPGGWIGRVDSVARDGRSFGAVAGGLSDVVDYLDADLSLAEVGRVPMRPLAGGQPREGLGQPRRSLLPERQAGAAAPRQRVVTGSCLDDAVASQLTLDSTTMDVSGRFAAFVRKVGNKPPTAEYDLEVLLDGDLSVGLDTTDDVQCTTSYAPVYVTLLTRPVPVVAAIQPLVSVQAGTGVRVSGLGVRAQGGFALSGGLGTDRPSGGRTLLRSATPSTPTVSTTGRVLAGMGAYVALGAVGGRDTGAAYPQAWGTLAPTVLQTDTYFTGAGDPRRDSCLVAGGYSQAMVGLDPVGFLGRDTTVAPPATPDGWQAMTTYPGTPWYSPSGCEQTPDPGQE